MGLTLQDLRPDDRAECPACNGQGSTPVIVGDGEYQEPCEACGGMGYQLTRDEFADLEALQGDRDLRLAPEPNDTPSFRNHADEIAWVIEQHRKAS